MPPRKPKRRPAPAQLRIPAGPPPLADLAGLWLAWGRVEWARGTLRARASRMRKLTAELPDHPTPEQLDRWLHRLVAAGGSSRTAARYVSDLRCLADYVRAHRIVPGYEGPADVLRTRWRQAEAAEELRARDEHRAIGPAELARLLAACPDAHARLLLSVLAHTGCRVGEALALRPEDLDVARRLVTIGARRETKGLVRLPRKWNEAPVALPMREPLALAVVEARRERMARQGPRWQGERGRRFVLAYSDEQLAALGRLLDARAPGILPPTRQRWHAFRHSLAVRLAEQATPLSTLARVLGHRRESTTSVYLSRYRARPTEESVREAFARLAESEAAELAAAADLSPIGATAETGVGVVPAPGVEQRQNGKGIGGGR